jgi:ketosteroid isomerase-like protein
MGDERVQWFRDALVRWNEGERETDWDRLHPDFELESVMLGGTARGEEGIRRWWREIDQQFDAWEMQVTGETDLGGDRFLITGTLRMRGRESGLAMDQEIAWLLRFEGDRLLHLKPFTDLQTAREEAGL